MLFVLWFLLIVGLFAFGVAAGRHFEKMRNVDLIRDHDWKNADAWRTMKGRYGVLSEEDFVEAYSTLLGCDLRLKILRNGK